MQCYENPKIDQNAPKQKKKFWGAPGGSKGQ